MQMHKIIDVFKDPVNTIQAAPSMQNWLEENCDKAICPPNHSRFFDFGSVVIHYDSIGEIDRGKTVICTHKLTFYPDIIKHPKLNHASMQLDYWAEHPNTDNEFMYFDQRGVDRVITLLKQL